MKRCLHFIFHILSLSVPLLSLSLSGYISTSSVFLSHQLSSQFIFRLTLSFGTTPCAQSHPLHAAEPRLSPRAQMKRLPVLSPALRHVHSGPRVSSKYADDISVLITCIYQTHLSIPCALPHQILPCACISASEV